MTRHYYIECRNNGLIGNILYTYYKEEAPKRGFSILSSKEFLTAYNFWPLGNKIMKELLRVKDIEFEVTKLEDKNGKTIKYI